MGDKFDYGAWATKNNIRCADGRIIRKGAFKDMNGKKVPLVWNHDHKDMDMVLGHALLEDRDEGIYAYLSVNPDTRYGKQCKSLIEHGDVTSVSIYANGLTQNENGEVFHGIIREVSIVLAGANPGAYIDAILAHKDDPDDALVAYFEEDDSFEHSILSIEDNAIEHSTENTPAEETGSKEDNSIEHSAEEDGKGDNKMNEDKTVGEVFEDIKKKLSDEEMNVIYGIIGMAAEGESEGNEGGEDMKHNAFEGEDFTTGEELIHSALHDIFVDAKKYGSLKESYLAHAEEVEQYGIDHMEYFQTPEGTDIYDRPQFITTKPNGWVNKVLAGVHHTPFAKVRMMFADITEDEARAKGYIKGNYKKEEFFKLQKRTVSPTTIYKKQKFDRDDLADADWDIIPWVKAEMSVKLDEEKARAYIFGDGRSNGDEDKINEANIIPVVKEDELFLVTVQVSAPASSSAADQKAFAENLIDQMVLAQDDYTGSGDLTAFVEAKQVSKMLLLKDEFGHRLYKTLTELASAMGVSEVVKVPAAVMPADHYAVALDLSDYNVGVKDMGKRSMFSDFDIDYNQMKYLLEERQSGCLIRPKSAIVIKKTSNAG